MCVCLEVGGGVGWRGAITATLQHLLSPQLPAFSFIRSALTLLAF